MSLLQEVDAIEQESIKPLDECQKLIEHGVSTANDLLREGKAGPDTESWLYLLVCLFFRTVMIRIFGSFWTFLKLNVKKKLKLDRCSEELISIFSYKSVFKYLSPVLGVRLPVYPLHKSRKYLLGKRLTAEVSCTAPR